MRHEIVFATEAIQDLNRLKANVKAAVRNAIEVHLRNEPTKTSKSRIKRLRGLSHPEYRLRVGDEIRVYYDVTDDEVQILAIIPKSEADGWLAEHGEADETDSAV